MVFGFLLILINNKRVSGVLDCSTYINAGSTTYDQHVQLKACFAANSYMKEFIPGNNPNGSNKFKINYDFKAISYLASEIGVMILTFELFVGWADERKAWTSGSTSLTETWVSPSELWYPIFYLADCISENCVVKPEDTEFLKITKDGFVSFRILRKYDFICDMVLDDFPFDYQVCHLHFVIQDNFIYAYTIKIENISYFIQKSTSNEIVQANGEWRIKERFMKGELINIVHRKVMSTPLQGSDIDVTKEKGFTLIIRFQRYIWNYLFVIVVPCVIFSLFPVLVTCVPKESGEKVSFAMVVLLTIIFFESLLLTILPNAATYPWIMQFVFIGSSFSLLFVPYAILVVLGYDMGIFINNHKIFIKIMKLLSWCDIRICCCLLPKSLQTQNQVKPELEQFQSL